MIHPSVKMVDLPGGKIQIRGLFEKFTIGDGGLIKIIIETVKLKKTEENVLKFLSTQPNKDYLLAAFQFLKEKMVFKIGEIKSEFVEESLNFYASLYQNEGNIKGEEKRTRNKVKILLFGEGCLFDSLNEELEERNIEVINNPKKLIKEKDCIAVVVSDNPNYPFLRELNKKMAKVKIPTLFSYFEDTSFFMGPFVIYEKTPCFECYYHRLRSTVQFRNEFDSIVCLNELQSDKKLSLKRFSKIGSFFIFNEVVKYLNNSIQISVLGQSVELNPIQFEIKKSKILKLPRCVSCGTVGTPVEPLAAIRDMY